MRAADDLVMFVIITLRDAHRIPVRVDTRTMMLEQLDAGAQTNELLRWFRQGREPHRVPVEDVEREELGRAYLAAVHAHLAATARLGSTRAEAVQAEYDEHNERFGRNAWW